MTKCPHCNGTGQASANDLRQERAFTDRERIGIGLFFAVILFLIIIGLGGGIALATGLGLLAWPIMSNVSKSVDKKLGLRR